MMSPNPRSTSSYVTKYLTTLPPRLIFTHRKCIAKHMINPRISADWSTTKTIAAFSCIPSVQEVHTKAEVVHLTPGFLDLGFLFNCHTCYAYCAVGLPASRVISDATTKQ